MNNCLNPNDKHLLSWISRQTTAIPARHTEHCAKRGKKKARKKKCERKKKQVKENFVFFFRLPAHNLPRRSGKRFKLNMQSVWSALAQGQVAVKVGGYLAVFACCVLCVQLICAQFGWHRSPPSPSAFRLLLFIYQLFFSAKYAKTKSKL